MPLNPRDADDLDRAERVVARLREEWAEDPNVVAIGPGLRIAGYRAVPDELIITFFVKRKLAPEEIERLGLRAVPPEVDGIPTDVEPTAAGAHYTALEKRRERRDPLLGGIAMGNSERYFRYGTLGAIVFDNATGEQMALTNEHVLIYSDEGHVGDLVIQPAPPRISDFIDIDFTPDCCPTGGIFFVESPGPITSILSTLAGMAAIVGCADVRDPTRRGQDATVPSPGEVTVRERVDVELRYADFPIPGTPYTVRADWQYTRETTGASYTHAVTEANTNEHVLDLQRLQTDQTTYKRGEIIHLLATLVSPRERPCDSYHVVCYLVPGAPGQQVRSHMLVLRPVIGKELEEVKESFPGLQIPGDVGRICFYYGRIGVEQADPLGPWRTYLFAQTVNTVATGVDPEAAAPTIGGLPVTRNFEFIGEGSLTPGGPEGCMFKPFVDGDFDVVP
jgi:hypothetical protein